MHKRAQAVGAGVVPLLCGRLHDEWTLCTCLCNLFAIASLPMLNPSHPPTLASPQIRQRLWVRNGQQLLSLEAFYSRAYW